jgi:uncharacterized protein
LQETSAWLPRRRLEAEHKGIRLGVWLDDLEPNRDCYRMAVADRLPDEEIAEWQALLDDAWALLVEHAPARAAELTTGVRAMVPLAKADGTSDLSATSRDATGALALTMPATGADLATTLVHEHQHTKLSVVQDLVPLCSGSDQPRYFAPWRRDPRPISGLIQGAYAFAGVADTWHRLRSSPEVSTVAEWRFAEIREQVWLVIDTLSRSADLTPAGRSFVAGMRTAVQTMMQFPVAPDAVAHGRGALARAESAWRSQNSAPDK